MPGHRPEVAGDQRQHAEYTSAEPHEKTRNDEQRATKIKNDSDARAEPARGEKNTPRLLISSTWRKRLSMNEGIVSAR
jgi:hypothetical protein